MLASLSDFNVRRTCQGSTQKRGLDSGICPFFISRKKAQLEWLCGNARKVGATIRQPLDRTAAESSPAQRYRAAVTLTVSSLGPSGASLALARRECPFDSPIEHDDALDSEMPARQYLTGALQQPFDTRLARIQSGREKSE